jgi:hypothetical protein
MLGLCSLFNLILKVVMAFYLCYAYTDGIDFTLKEYQDNKNR